MALGTVALVGEPGAGVERGMRLGRVICGLAAVAMAVAGWGLYHRADWAMALWPWDAAEMTFVFFASIAAAIAVPLARVAIRGDLAVLAPILLQLLVAALAMGIALTIEGARTDDGQMKWLAGGLLGTAGVLVFPLRWLWRTTPRDRRRTPGAIRAAFAGFVLVLVGGGSALIARVDNVMPWEIAPITSTVFGLIFWGSALLFTINLVRPYWAYGEVVLASFFAYDLVLIIPYLQMFNDDDAVGSDGMYGGMYGYGSTAPDAVNERGLVIYLIVIGVSGALAVWSLLLQRRTRIWGASTSP